MANNEMTIMAFVSARNVRDYARITVPFLRTTTDHFCPKCRHPGVWRACEFDEQKRCPICDTIWAPGEDGILVLCHAG